MRVFADQKFYVLLAFCFAVACALTFLIIPATGSAGHNDGGDQCISDERFLGVSQTKTLTVDGDGVEVTFNSHDDSKDEVNLDVDGTSVSVPEDDIGDGGTDKGKWNDVSITSSLEVRIPGATGDGGGNIFSISVQVHDTGCDGDDGGDGGQCAPDETLEKEWTKLGDYGSCGDYKNGDGCNVSDSNNGSTGWASDSVPDCGETETYITSDGCSIGGTGSDMENCIFGGGTEQRTQQCNCVGGNDPPTADDDGTVDAGICADGGVKIYVLDNDEDEDGDQLEITDVGIPTSNADGSVNGTTAAFDDDSDGVKDAILYTPSNSPDTVTFDYTISDGNDNTDTATVTVNVTDGGCGSLTVRVEDPNGNLVPGVGFEPKYDEDNDGQPERLPEKGLENGKFTYNVTVDDDPSLSKMNEDLITQFPEGFATSVDKYRKKVETTDGQDEPDDHTYQNKNLKKSKLATDPSSTPPPSTVTCYEDQDGDSYGKPGTDTERNSCQSGEVQNDNDCYDQNAEANPDQTSFFTEDRGDGSFDYNCDGQEEKAGKNWGNSCSLTCPTNSCSGSCTEFDSGGWPNGATCGNDYDIGTQYYCQDAFGECNKKSSNLNSTLSCR